MTIVPLRKQIENPRYAWEKQPWETETAYSAFRQYLAEVPPRTLASAWRHNAEEKKTLGQKVPAAVPKAWYWYFEGRDYRRRQVGPRWEARAREYDDHMRKREEEMWLSRRMEIRKSEWELGNQLMARAGQMLKFPLVRTSKTEDGKTTVFEPVDWRVSDIPRVAETASKLQRLAADMATDKTEVVTREEAMIFVARVADVVRRKVGDESIVRAIGEEIAALAGTRVSAEFDEGEFTEK